MFKTDCQKKNTARVLEMSDKKYVKIEISHSLKCRKSTRNKDTHKALILKYLSPQLSSKCRICDAKKSVFVKKCKPDKRQK